MILNGAYVTESSSLRIPAVSGLRDESDGTRVSVGHEGATNPADASIAYDGNNGEGGIDTLTELPGTNLESFMNGEGELMAQ